MGWLEGTVGGTEVSTKMMILMTREAIVEIVWVGRIGFAQARTHQVAFALILGHGRL
jgi:hypothetical protein